MPNLFKSLIAIWSFLLGMFGAADDYNKACDTAFVWLTTHNDVFGESPLRYMMRSADNIEEVAAYFYSMGDFS